MRSKAYIKILFIIFFISIVFLGVMFSVDVNEDIKKFDKEDTLEEIREKILHNGYGFSVDHNWVFDMSKEEKKLFFTRRKPKRKRLAFVSKGMGPLQYEIGKKVLPAKFDWRDHNGHSYIGKIRNQGGCGSCYSFGAAATAEGVYNVATGRYDAHCVDFSESFIMWCLGKLPEYNYNFFGCDGADYEYAELSALVKYGITNETDFPYAEADPGECSHFEQPRVKFKAWYRIECNNIEAIKTAIMTYGVVDAAVLTTNAMTAYSSGVYDDANITCSEIPCYYERSDHAIALVGWDDDDQAFILRNSWGEYWGENGYMKIKYSAAGVSCAVTYLVMGPIISLTLSGEKNELNFWAFTLKYADLVINVSNPSGMDVNRFILKRKEVNGNYKEIKIFYSEDIVSGKYYFADKYLAKNYEYNYIVDAIDNDGNIISTSNMISLKGAE